MRISLVPLLTGGVNSQLGSLDGTSTSLHIGCAHLLYRRGGCAAATLATQHPQRPPLLPYTARGNKKKKTAAAMSFSTRGKFSSVSFSSCVKSATAADL